VTIATEPDGTPILLLSRLALHTQNLAADARASLLIDGTSGAGDPLAGGRVTLTGRAEPTPSTTARRRFLARHRDACTYADFPDFQFYCLSIERIHFVGGFGRIVDLGRDDLLLALEGADALVAAEADIVSHMNEDHAGALELYATVLCGAPGGPWRMTGIDPEGCDILLDGDARRILFATRIASPGAARQELVRLTAEARERGKTP
jgi:putative heme iron utilization protein